MDEQALDDRVVEFIRRRGHPTYVEVADFMARHMPVEGDFAVEAGHIDNVILYGGGSREFVEMMSRVGREHRVFHHVCSPAFYERKPQLPVADPPFLEDYPVLHWRPTFLCVYAPGECPYVTQDDAGATADGLRREEE